MTIESVALCIVVYNEIERIHSTIAKVSQFVDEICVVDQQSTDGTWEWLNDNSRLMNLNIASDKHWGFCEPSRKKAHELSSAQWVLVLDADERLDDDFGSRMRDIDDGNQGARLQRSLWIGGEHRFTGDYQYRYFRRDCVRYLNEIHTEPQPTIPKTIIFSEQKIGIWHEKSWQEQIRDELAYEDLLRGEDGISADRKRELNVHLALLRSVGITAEQADAMTIEERQTLGIGAGSA